MRDIIEGFVGWFGVSCVSGRSNGKFRGGWDPFMDRPSDQVGGVTWL